LLTCDTCGMKETIAPPSYSGYRFPPEIIARVVWLYFRFTLSYRDVEELLAERGVILTDETVRQWCRTFGQAYANELRCRRPKPGDKWLYWLPCSSVHQFRRRVSRHARSTVQSGANRPPRGRS